MAVGNAELIRGLFVIKSNVDSGVNQAIQKMGITALAEDQACIADNNAKLQRRRDLLVAALQACGLRIQTPKASLYVWARIPDGYTSAEFATRLIEDIAVVVTPGTNFGKAGEGFVRLSLTAPDDRVEEGARRITEWAKQNS
jgi:LL-diaminopimelate aminotransferase